MAKNTSFPHQIFLKLTGSISLGKKLKNLKENLVGHAFGVEVPKVTGCLSTQMTPYSVSDIKKGIFEFSAMKQYRI